MDTYGILAAFGRDCAGAIMVLPDGDQAKARRDLNGLLYADGIHDSLYRAVGRALIARPPARALRPIRALQREG